MKLRLAALAGGLALGMALSACAYDDGYYGPSAAYANVDYVAWYDGFYGPFYGGYWGPRGRFYYWDQAHHRYHRDVGHHFAHGNMPGFNAVHGRAPPPAGGRQHGPEHRR